MIVAALVVVSLGFIGAVLVGFLATRQFETRLQYEVRRHKDRYDDMIYKCHLKHLALSELLAAYQRAVLPLINTGNSISDGTLKIPVGVPVKYMVMPRVTIHRYHNCWHEPPRPELREANWETYSIHVDVVVPPKESGLGDIPQHMLLAMGAKAAADAMVEYRKAHTPKEER